MTRDELLIGEYLSAARRKADITQQSIADHIGKHVQFISNIERNVSPPPSYVIRAYVETCRIQEKDFLSMMLDKRRSWVEKEIFGRLKKRR